MASTSDNLPRLYRECITAIDHIRQIAAALQADPDLQAHAKWTETLAEIDTVCSGVAIILTEHFIRSLAKSQLDGEKEV